MIYLDNTEFIGCYEREREKRLIHNTESMGCYERERKKRLIYERSFPVKFMKGDL